MKIQNSNTNYISTYQCLYNILILILVLTALLLTGSNQFKKEQTTHVKDTLIVYTYNEPNFYKMSPEKGLMRALKYYNVKHPKVVYAQAILETDHFTSDNCLKKNNLFGLYNSKTNKYYTFKHWSESVLAYKRYVQYKYKSDSSYYAFLKSMHYASDNEYVSKLQKIINKNK